jgi:hypothetical protein
MSKLFELQLPVKKILPKGPVVKKIHKKIITI